MEEDLAKCFASARAEAGVGVGIGIGGRVWQREEEEMVVVQVGKDATNTHVVGKKSVSEQPKRALWSSVSTAKAGAHVTVLSGYRAKEWACMQKAVQTAHQGRKNEEESEVAGQGDLHDATLAAVAAVVDNKPEH